MESALSAEVLDPCVVERACLFDQQEIKPGHVLMLFAETVYDDVLVPSKQIGFFRPSELVDEYRSIDTI